LGAAVAAITVPGRAVLSLISLAVMGSQLGRQIDGEPYLSAVHEDQRRGTPAGADWKGRSSERPYLCSHNSGANTLQPTVPLTPEASDAGDFG
jgi:hypothetical protein